MGHLRKVGDSHRFLASVSGLQLGLEMAHSDLWAAGRSDPYALAVNLVMLVTSLWSCRSGHTGKTIELQENHSPAVQLSGCASGAWLWRALSLKWHPLYLELGLL